LSSSLNGPQSHPGRLGRKKEKPYFLPLLALGQLAYPVCSTAIVQQNAFDPSFDSMEMLIIWNLRRVFARLEVLLFTREGLRH